jgi:aminoglycoside 2'-N-acetyltransferase I
MSWLVRRGCGDMDLVIQVVPASRSPGSDLDEIRALCTEAYEEDFSGAFELSEPGGHLLGRLGGKLVSHAMWMTRWLQPGARAPLRTAYVEGVATAAAARGRGLASQLLRRLVTEVVDFDLAALSPSDDGFYARLGWSRWRGPLLIRGAAGLEPTSEASVMVFPLPRTPPLNLDDRLTAEWRPGDLW